MTAVSDFLDYLKGQVDSVGASGSLTQAAALQLIQLRRAQVIYPVDAAAGTDIEIGLLDTPYAGTVTRLTIVPNAALTASASVYATLTFSWADGAAGTPTTFASLTTDLSANGGTGNWVNATRITVTLSATIANRTFLANSYLKVAKTHASTGTVVPCSLITVHYKEEGP